MIRTIKSRIRNKVVNFTLRKKIISIILIANAFLISIFILFSLQLLIKADNRLLTNSISNDFSKSTAMIEMALGDTGQLAADISTDPMIQEFLLRMQSSLGDTESSDTKEVLENRLLEYYNDYNQEYIEFIDINTNYTTISTNKEISDQTYPVIYSAIVRKGAFAEGMPQWSTRHSNKGYIYLSQAILNTEYPYQESLGVVIIKLDLKLIIEDIINENYGNRDAGYVIVDGLNHIVYQSSELINIDVDSLNALKRYDYTIITQRQQNYFVVNTPLLDYNMDYYCFVPYDSIAESMSYSMIIYLVVIIISLLLSIFVSTKLIGLVTKDFDNLIYKISNFRGNSDAIINIKDDYSDRQDDLGLLHQQFNSMATEIHDLIQENYTNELLIKETRIKVLETQINPHFLYNTLESVNWRAKSIKATQISQMIESLGRLLRESLDEDEGLITIQRELNFIDDYILIQSIRYEEQLHFSMDIDPEATDSLIPKLTIQPLIENAIRYGLEENTNGCDIFLSIKRQIDEIHICVKNSGTYIDPDLLSKLESKDYEHKGTGIGLLNIHKRFQLNFGERYSINFDNQLDYAIINIKIPFKEE